jgi:diguanylate cyclase (GGDEF)-like protein/PAS domain S-box-containing protein
MMGKPLKVLLVEDSEDDAELVLDELARGGFEPEAHRVDRLPELRQALAERQWDVVLSDFNIIDFTAAEALRAVHESRHDLPFLILSGAVQAEQAVSLLKLGAHDFLNKDALARLIPAIEREMRESAERTQRRLAEERVRILSLAIEQSPVSVVITDRDGRIDYANPKFEQVTGYSLAEARGRDLGFTLIEHAGNPIDGIRATVAAGHEWRGEFCNLRRDGQLFWEYATVSPLKDENGRISHFVAVKEDITVRRSYEERLLRQSHYDDLTGLPNRILMLDRLDQAMALAHRSRSQVALLCMDLDHFKNVNDMLGHAMGDALLKQVAQRLGGVVRESDTLARLGGDEFVVILPGIDDGAEAQRMAQRMQEALAPPIRLDGQEHFVTASIGITLYPLDGDDPQVLLRNADLAMYKAKEIGRDRYRFFTQEINQRLQERLALEVQLRGAVRRGEMLLHYQPIVDLATTAPVGVEALVRWRRTDGGLVMPDTFIPIAEELGLIRELGEWVVQTACGAIDQLGQDLRVAVNVSPRQLRETGFGTAVRRLLAETGLNPRRLELEITERVLMDDTPETAENLKMLCDLGVRLSIDDFGTGYSSLGYLQKFPFDTLKIDRSFVADALGNPGVARLVETIIAMAHGLDLQVIAEGVETAAQRDFLRARGCDQAQGYLFARPLPPDQLAPILPGLAGGI